MSCYLRHTLCILLLDAAPRWAACRWGDIPVSPVILAVPSSLPFVAVHPDLSHDYHIAN
jgi:hypothetical protein